MKPEPIDLTQLRVDIHNLWNRQWFILTAGDFKQGDFNAMTVSWGSLGTLWNIPFTQVFVRPTRYTYTFMERYRTFTLCVLPESHRKAAQLLGSRSGRDGDKIADSGLTPVAASSVEAPIYDEAELALECRQLYAQDMDPQAFMDPRIDAHYEAKDYHRIYFGQVLAAHGRAAYTQGV